MDKCYGCRLFGCMLAILPLLSVCCAAGQHPNVQGGWLLPCCLLLCCCGTSGMQSRGIICLYVAHMDLLTLQSVAVLLWHQKGWDAILGHSFGGSVVGVLLFFWRLAASSAPGVCWLGSVYAGLGLLDRLGQYGCCCS